MAGEPKSVLSLETGLTLMTGKVSYRIGGLTEDPVFGNVLLPYPISELAFDSRVAATYTRLRVMPAESNTISFELAWAPTQLAGQMRDSDWGVFSAPGVLDVYSVSDAWLGYIALNVGVYRRTPSDLWLGVGLAYEHMAFKVQNLLQWRPSDPGYPRIFVPGTALLLDLDVWRPYIGVEKYWDVGQPLELGLGVQYTPVMIVDYVDDHVLREKLSHSEELGYAVDAFFSMMVQAKHKIFIGMKLAVNITASDGRQRQTDYSVTPNEWIATLQSDFKGARWMGTLTVGRTF